MKIVKSLEQSGLSLKGINKTIKDEAKEQKGRFLSMLLRTLAANMLGRGVIRAGEGTIKASEKF